MSKLIVFFFVFNSLFGPRLNFLNIDVYSIGNVLAIPIFGFHTWKRYMLPIYTWILMVWFYFSFVLIINSVYDGEWLMKGPRLILNLISVFVISEYSLRKFGVGFFLQLIVFSCLVHGLIIAFQLFNPTFNFFIIDTFSRQEVEISTIEFEVIRFSGLSRSYLISTLLLFYGFFLYIFIKKNWIYRFMLPILVPAFIVGSRSSLVLSLFGIGVYFLFKIKGVFNYLKLLIFFSAFILFIFSLNMIIDFLPDGGVKSSIKYGTEAFLLVNNENDSESSSLNDFLSHKFIILNNSLFEHLFGTGNFGRIEGNKIPTDIGYALQYNGFGIFGTILCILPYIFFVSKIRSIYFRFFTLVFYITVLFLNYKEGILLSRGLFSFQIYLLVIGYNYFSLPRETKSLKCENKILSKKRRFY